MDKILHYLYLIIDEENRKYIGVTNNPDRRYREHCNSDKFLSNIIFNVICEGNKNFIYYLEKKYVEKYNPYYNKTSGGIGGNGCKGEEHWNSFLKGKDIINIRELYATKIYTQFEIGKMYNIDNIRVSQITTGKDWKHIEGSITFSENRGAKGSSNHHAKLAERDVLDIREINKICNMKLTGKIVSESYGITISSANKILRGDSWKHVGGPIRGIHG